jgi:hypothetical protein
METLERPKRLVGQRVYANWRGSGSIAPTIPIRIAQKFVAELKRKSAATRPNKPSEPTVTAS